jgi:O-antigen ligase
MMPSDLVVKEDRAAGKTREFLGRAGTATVGSASAAFFWLSAFYLVYCARPEDWIPGLLALPLAKITAVFALIALISSSGRTKRKFRDRPKEANYLLALIALLFVSGMLSPVWKGGALSHTLDFSKVVVAWMLTYMVVTDFKQLRRIIYIQAASVAVIAIVSIIKGHNTPRLFGVLGGIYSNPNDLAFAIVLSLPFCLAFLLSAKSALKKLAWGIGMLVMAAALFLTASRAGFIDLVVAGAVCLWHMGVKGRRYNLIVVALVSGTLVMLLAGGLLKQRFEAISGEDMATKDDTQAYSSYEARAELIRTALETIAHYPILGVGVDNFVTLSGDWHEVHMTYLQITVEGGIPAFILYLLFFGRGFSNLRQLRRRRDLDVETILFVGALHSSLIGFVVGALFAPEAYQFFPYFAVAFTAALLAIVQERDAAAASLAGSSNRTARPLEIYAIDSRSESLARRN